MAVACDSTQQLQWAQNNFTKCIFRKGSELYRILSWVWVACCQVSIFRPTQCNVFIRHPDDRTYCPCRHFTQHTHTQAHTHRKQHHIVGTVDLEVRGQGGYSHGTVTDWRNGISTNLLKFHKDSCEVIRMQGIKNMQRYRIDTEWREVALQKRPRNLKDNEFYLRSQRCILGTMRGQPHPGWSLLAWVQPAGQFQNNFPDLNDSLYLFSHCNTICKYWFGVLDLGLLATRKTWPLIKWVQTRTRRRPRCWSIGYTIRFVWPHEESWMGNLIAAFSYLRGRHRKGVDKPEPSWRCTMLSWSTTDTW